MPVIQPFVRDSGKRRCCNRVRRALTGNHTLTTPSEMREVLRKLSFGNQVAEEERDTLKDYFVKTQAWDRINNGDIDILNVLPVLLFTKCSRPQLGQVTASYASALSPGCASDTQTSALEPVLGQKIVTLAIGPGCASNGPPR